MNKNFKIVQVHGLSGLLIIGFIAIGLFAGFIIFPIWAVMHLWNYIVAKTILEPQINYYQSTLLWSAVILIAYVYFRKNVSIKIQKEDKADYSELNEVISDLKEDDKETQSEPPKE